MKGPTTAFFIFLMRWDGEMDSLKWENPLGLVALKGDKVYILTYEAGINEYDKYLPIIQELINSFQLAK